MVLIAVGIRAKSKVEAQIWKFDWKAFKSVVDIPIGWADGSSVGNDGGTIGGENQG